MDSAPFASSLCSLRRAVANKVPFASTRYSYPYDAVKEEGNLQLKSTHPRRYSKISSEDFWAITPSKTNARDLSTRAESESETQTVELSLDVTKDDSNKMVGPIEDAGHS